MTNHCQVVFEPTFIFYFEVPIKLGLEDPNETVRDFTRGICSKLGISF